MTDPAEERRLTTEQIARAFDVPPWLIDSSIPRPWWGRHPITRAIHSIVTGRYTP